jgi:hypothetical protein
MEDVPNSQFIENKISLVIGALLIAIIHTLFNLGLLVFMFNAIKKLHKDLSRIYLLLGAFGAILLAIGAVFLLLPLGFSETMLTSEKYDRSTLEMIIRLSAVGNTYAYHLGMILWSLGGLCLCPVLYLSKSLPLIFSIWGFIVYLIFVGGCVLVLFGGAYGVIFSVPGGLFELG